MAKTPSQLVSVDMPIYRYWQALYRSLYSAELYIDVAKRWRGIGCIYILLLVSVVTIPLATRITFGMNQYIEESVLSPFRNMPQLQIQNGSVTFNQPMPYLMKNSHDEVVAIVDTTGQIKNIQTYPLASILVTKDHFYYRLPKLHLFFMSKDESPKEDILVESFADYDDQSLGGEEWIKSSGIVTLNRMWNGFTYPLLVMFTFSIALVQIIVFATVGQIVSQLVFKFTLHFKTACRLMAVASTGQILFLFSLLVTNYTIKWAGFISMVLIVAYFSYAILSVKQASQKMVFL